MVMLFHVTDDAGKRGIQKMGFGVSRTPDSPRSAWLRDDQHHPQLTNVVGEWWVIVEVPDDVAEANRYEHDNHMFCVPWVVLNAYRPFGYQRT